MLAANIPYKFAQPWAAAASPGFINKPIPVVSQSGVKASQALGFPPATSLNLAAGGTPPDIADFNGMMHYATSWIQWFQAGGPRYYDATFVSQIGGYPHGAQIQSINDARVIWTNSVDGNTTNPDAGGTGWVAINGYPWTWIPTQTFFQGLQTTGFDSAGFNIKLVGGQYGVGFRNDGVNFYLLSTFPGQPFGTWSAFRPFTYNLSSGAVTIDAGASGTTIGGSVTVNGNLQTLHDIQANGNFAALGFGQFNGPLTANQYIRIAQGARNSGDGNRAVVLGDFILGWTSLNLGYTIDPSGSIDQTVAANCQGVQGTTIGTQVVLPIAFPSFITDAVCCWGGTSPPANVGLACQPSSNRTVLVTITAPGPGSGAGVFAVVVRSRGY